METRNKVLMVFGIILLIIGFVASFYQEQRIFSGGGLSNSEVFTPYRDMGMVLAVAGIVFIALGFLNLSRRGFLVVGLVLLILGFFFFYWASRVNWDYVTEHKETVNVGYPTSQSDFGLGNSYYYPVIAATIEMQSNDLLTIQCPDTVSSESIYIVLLGSNLTVLKYGLSYVVYQSFQPYEIVDFYLAIPANQNITTATVSTTATLNHYETPQWGYFAIGVVLSLLAVIPIFKSNSKPKPISTEGFSQAERGI